MQVCCLSGRVDCQDLVVSCWEIAPSVLNHVVIWHSVVQEYTVPLHNAVFSYLIYGK